MNGERTDKIFRDVKNISLSRVENGYDIAINNRHAVRVLHVANFEWRAADGAAPAFTRIYFGNESGGNNECKFSITFDVAHDVRISNPDARCYIYIGKQV
jgi:hypothetical protein